MRILYLPGNTANHKEWIDKLTKDTDISLEKDILHYKHWETGDQIINFDTELERLRDLVKDDEYIVVGKSAGCALGLMAYKQKIVNAKRFIFLGFPYLWLEKLG
jgi:pimeloyl-ACP methyl ester carboxylesterase